MSTNPPNQISFSPGVTSLIPLFYVGWADSVLSPSEIKLIQKKISELPFLDQEDKVTLKDWSNPAKPPSQALFKTWVKLLKDAAQNSEVSSRQSLSELGIEMALKTAHIHGKTDVHWHASETRNALDDLEKALGIGSLESYSQIFTTQQIKLERDEVLIGSRIKVEELRVLLDDDYPELKNRMRTLLSDSAFKYQRIPDKDEYRGLILHWTKLLAEQGLGAISYPVAQGGEDDMGKYCTVFEMLGYHDLSLAIKFGVQFGLFGGSVNWLGTERHHEKYLKDIGTLELAGCFAMTETGHGSNVRGLQTTATYNEETDELVINTPTEEDGKEYIGNALHGRMASVFAQLIVKEENQGVHAILVPYRTKKGELLPGIRVEDCGYKLGLNGVDNGKIWFDKVRVPRENLLNKFGDIDEHGKYSSPISNPSKRFFTMLGTLVGGRVCVPRAGLSATKAGLAIAIRHALKRRQFAPSETEPETLLLDYPSHQRRLMPLLAKTYAIDFALTYLAKRYVNRSEDDIREIETLAAGLKSYATWFTTETLQECREACGGKGYLAENRISDLKADSDIFTTFEGDNTVLMQLVAKGLLSNFKKEFHDEGFKAVIRMVSKQLYTSVAEKNPITTRNADASHLMDTEWQLAAFRFRERKQLYDVSQRMRSLLQKRLSPNDAFLRCQNHMISLANAYVERIVLEQFNEVLNKQKDSENFEVLKRICDLYALSSIEKDKGWFLETEYIHPTKSKALRRVVTKLCKEVRIDSACLVDAFAIPDELLAAPIALTH